jgi:hypothetical protein
MSYRPRTNPCEFGLISLVSLALAAGCGSGAAGPTPGAGGASGTSSGGASGASGGSSGSGGSAAGTGGAAAPAARPVARAVGHRAEPVGPGPAVNQAPGATARVATAPAGPQRRTPPPR